jgi:hypothetical protein
MEPACRVVLNVIGVVMTQQTEQKQSVMELAQQGNPKAIAAFINHKLQPAGITAQAALKDGCLQIILESNKPLDKQKSLAFIRQVIVSLQLKLKSSIKAVAVCAKKTGEDKLLWQQKQLLTDRTTTTAAVIESKLAHQRKQVLAEQRATAIAAAKHHRSDNPDQGFTAIDTIDSFFAYFGYKKGASKLLQSQKPEKRILVEQSSTAIAPVQRKSFNDSDKTVDALFAYF